MQDYSHIVMQDLFLADFIFSISLITISLLVNLETSKSTRLLLDGLNPFLLAGSKV
jgi:hypothetical protein